MLNVLAKKRLSPPQKKREFGLFANSLFFFVEVPGFEPGTPCSQSRCANRTALHLDFATANVVIFFEIKNN